MVTFTVMSAILCYEIFLQTNKLMFKALSKT